MGLTCFKSWKYDSAAQKGGNRDVLVSPGSYFFLSNSCGQGEEWLKTLNKGVWIPFTGVFGQRLEETVLYERRYGVNMAPLVVEQCVDFIRERGLLEVGLFRQPGQATLVKELQDAFDAGEKPSFDSSTDVHTVASLLKLYLRELPEPLVPFSRYQDFLVCGKKISSERKQSLTELRHLLHQLPVANFNLLNYICQFLNEVQSYSSSNKMSTQNLATVFGPNILRPKAEVPESIIEVTLQAAPEPSSMLPIGWRGPEDPSWAAEQGTTGTSGSSEAQDSTLSVYDNLDTLQRMEEVAADGGWGSPAGPVEVEVGTASMVDTRSSWSSCEILSLEDSGSGVVRTSPGRGSTRFPSFRTDPGDEDLHPNSPASSSALTDAPLSTGSSEVFLPSAPPDLRVPPASQAMHWLLTGLRQQMARQRAEFEAKIQRLEKRNEALQGEVVGLRTSLEQQRRWYSVAEIKIRNVERARADADRRNTTLQREMEQFFDTFGELNAEARKSEG
eukprot:XP_013985078.1 PREDICTED: rho GTPase-activating protein 24-like isoform X4 [Salmo salar]